MEMSSPFTLRFTSPHQQNLSGTEERQASILDLYYLIFPNLASLKAETEFAQHMQLNEAN